MDTQAPSKAKDLVGYSWFWFAIIGLGLVFVLVDAKSIMVMKGAAPETQSLYTSIGRVLSVPILLACYIRSYRKGGAFRAMLCNHPLRMTAIALVFSLGIVLKLALTGLVDDGDGLFSYVALTEGLFAGLGNTLLLVAWGEWLLGITGTVALLIGALSFFVAGFVELGISATYANYAMGLFVVLPFFCLGCLFMTARLYDSYQASIHDPSSTAGPKHKGPEKVRATVDWALWYQGLALVFFLSILNCALQAPNITTHPDDFSAVLAQGLASSGIVLAGVATYVLVATRHGEALLQHTPVLIIPALMTVLYAIAILFDDWAPLSMLPVYINKKLLFIMAFMGALSQPAQTLRVAYLVLYALVTAASNIVFQTISTLSGTSEETASTLLQTGSFVAVLALFAVTYSYGKALGPHTEKENANDTAVARAILAAMFCQKGLTNREAEIAHLLADGHSSSEIAASLSLSPAAVRAHSSHIYAKLGVSSQRELMLVGASRSGPEADAP